MADKTSTRLPRQQRMLYREIPDMTCRPGCSDCCGPVPWSPAEIARVADVIPPGAAYETVRGISILVDTMNPLRCPFVGPQGGCTVYERRPFTCRLFGTAPAEPRLRCPHGCRPRRVLTTLQAADLRRRQHQISSEPSHDP